MSTHQSNPKGYFITAIGTDSGKTLISAIFCKAFGFDYWKPIQAGLESRDCDTISTLVKDVKIIPSRYELKHPMSPHAAADLEGVKVSVSDFQLPTDLPVIVEGAGGIMVPINENELMLDLIKKLNFKVILVSNFYLGSINHTLLTIDVLKRNQIEIAGIVFNGEMNEASLALIKSYSALPVLLHVPQLTEVTSEVVASLAQNLKINHEF